MNNEQNRSKSALTWARAVPLSAGLLFGACTTCEAQTRLTQEAWGTLADGSAVARFTLENSRGARVAFMPLGAAILALEVPDREGKLADVVLGYATARDYLVGNSAQFGLTIGRYANRIFGTSLLLGGERFALQTPPNRDGSPGSVVLHGGPEGFGNRLWSAAAIETQHGTGIRFSLTSPDGDQGFPGEMQVAVTYQWTADYQLIVDYSATTSRPTVINLTQHSYFNLAGAGNGDILDHRLQINADFYTVALPDNRPTGEIRSVSGTPFDFSRAKPIGQDIAGDDAQLQQNRGYNQNFVLRRATVPGALTVAAELHDPASGRTLTVSTTEPGLFLYTANFIDTARAMKDGHRYPLRAGVALETGHFPDSPNLPHFPLTTLLPGQTFNSRTVFAFSAG